MITKPDMISLAKVLNIKLKKPKLKLEKVVSISVEDRLKLGLKTVLNKSRLTLN